jgi:integrase
MRVRDIDTHSIWVNAENAKTDESRRVEMVLPLKKLIQTQNLHQYNPNHYLFTQAGHPGEIPVGPGYFYKKQKRFLKAVGLDNRGHDLYCYKHSGAIQMIKAGLTAFDVMKMAGHKDVQITMDYLYNIGAISRLDGKGDNMPEI